MKVVAIITARGGSKRIPKKNIKEFCGKPIIAYSIEAALQSHIFNEVMVSTDSEEIAEIAKAYGASIPFMRSEKNANDIADTTDVLIEVLKSYKKIGKYYDEFCCIYPTAPFITAEKLVESHKLLEKEEVYNVVPMVPFSFPPQRGMVLREGMLQPLQPEAIDMRSQDLETVLHDCGQFYWCKTKAFLENKNLLSNHTVPFLVSEMEAQDIDNQNDWKLAELKFQMAEEKNGVNIN